MKKTEPRIGEWIFIAATWLVASPFLWVLILIMNTLGWKCRE